MNNISGMWLIQECRRRWKLAGEDYDYGRLAELAAEAAPFRSLIDPMDSRFLAPEDMPETIRRFCVETRQPEPQTPGAVVRCVLESLALLYRRTLEQVDALRGSRTERVHIVGGGSRNPLLNQFAANALQLPVETGPSEATALGNIVVQAIAMGDLPSLAAARALIRKSLATETVRPQAKQEWAQQFERFRRLVERTRSARN